MTLPLTSETQEPKDNRYARYDVSIWQTGTGLWQGSYKTPDASSDDKWEVTKLFPTPHEVFAIVGGEIGLVRGVPQLRLSGVDPASSSDFRRVLADMQELHDRKGADYGIAGDIYYNQHQASKWQVYPYQYALMRADEKMARLRAILTNDRDDSIANESMEESILDIAVLAGIAVVLHREQ